MDLLRKLLTILLLAFFGLPIVSPLFAESAMEAGRIPACCRRNGEHHCTMTATERNNLKQGEDPSRFAAPPETCPYAPAAVVAIHTNLLAVPVSDRVFAALGSHTSGAGGVDAAPLTRSLSSKTRTPGTNLKVSNSGSVLML
jgi:hypothetical protein